MPVLCGEGEKLGVKVVKGVIAHLGELGVKVKCLVGFYRKHYVGY